MIGHPYIMLAAKQPPALMPGLQLLKAGLHPEIDRTNMLRFEPVSESRLWWCGPENQQAIAAEHGRVRLAENAYNLVIKTNN